MSRAHFASLLLAALVAGCGAPTEHDLPPALPAPEPVEQVAIIEGRWHINGEVTYPGAAAQGLLLNVRMANAVFEDQRRPDIDPEAHLEAFLTALPDYVAGGVRAFTVSLQGGYPGYEGAVNSGFLADGSLEPRYLARLARVIGTAREHGAVVILSLFYQRQSGLLQDEAAVQRAVANAARWVREQGFPNVVLEIANEYGHRGFVPESLRTAQGQVELINLARAEAPGLLVATSGRGDGHLDPEVAAASDFLLVHFNDTALRDIPRRAAALKHYGKPIVCNEDNKVGNAGADAARASVRSGISWGFMHLEKNQTWPFEFKGRRDDPETYSALRALAATP